MRLKTRSEKILFSSLWAVLLLAGGLWTFWPNKAPVLEDPLPTVILGNELITWFQKVSVVEKTPTTFKIEIQLQQKYADEMKGDKRHVHLAYHFLRESTVLSQGVAEVEINPTGLIVLVLPNPNRVDARRIQLSLAH